MLRSLTISEIHKFENCQELESENDQIITWKNWQLYWTLIEAKEIILKQEQYWQCWNESTKWYIGFGTHGNYEDAFALCTSFGGSLPLPDTYVDFIRGTSFLSLICKNLNLQNRHDWHEELWASIEDLCNISRTWIAVTDFQEENKFLDVGEQTYKDIFIGSAIVGANLSNTLWGKDQPNGGIVENCVATYPGYGWYDYRCKAELCISCLIKINQEYKLRGLCKTTLFDTRFKVPIIHFPCM